MASCGRVTQLVIDTVNATSQGVVATSCAVYNWMAQVTRGPVRAPVSKITKPTQPPFALTTPGLGQNLVLFANDYSMQDDDEETLGIKLELRSGRQDPEAFESHE